MSKRLFHLLLLVSSGLSILLRAAVPPFPIYNSMFDDELMVVFANNIIDGQWLGDYTELGHRGLAKPPGYAIFLVLTRWLPWAPTVSVHLLLLAGLWLITHELRQLTLSRYLVVAFFIFVAFYPIWFNEPMSRIYRDGFLGALTMSLLGLALLTRRQLSTLSLSHRPLRSMGFRSVSRLLLPLLALGLLFGWFIITKNSWHFVVAIILGLWLSALPLRRSSLAGQLRLGISALVIVFVTTGLIVFSLAAKNNAAYGVTQMDTFTQGPFADAMKVMYSVRDNENRPYVDITAKMREKMYSVSPTFSKLRPYLELAPEQGWRATSCQSAMKICDESGAWFPWDLRDAVQSAGLGKSASAFNATFEAIAKEISAGCREKRILCERPGLAPGLDSLDSLSPRVIGNAFLYGVGELLNPDSGRSSRPVSQSITESQAQLWNRVARDLPPASFATDYEANSYMLVDARRVLGAMYGAIWPLIFITGLGGLFLGLSKRLTRRHSVIGIGLLFASAIFVGQLALIEASSGVYMIPGGQMYMICLYPPVFVGIVLGLSNVITRLKVQSLRDC